MAEETACENGQISNFEGLVTLTWIGSYCIPSCITHRPLPTCRVSLKSKNVFVDGRTYVVYVRTNKQNDRHLRLALLGRICERVDLKCVMRHELFNCRIDASLSFIPGLIQPIRHTSTTAVTCPKEPLPMRESISYWSFHLSPGLTM